MTRHTTRILSQTHRVIQAETLDRLTAEAMAAEAETDKHVNQSNMKIKLLLLLALAAALQLSAQTNKPSFIKGAMEIKFNTRVKKDASGIPAKGVTDDYRVDLNVSDSAVFKGSIAFTPHIEGGILGGAQPAALNYAVECDVVNPANPAQTRNVGRLYGVVPIEGNGLYKFNDGSLKIAVHAMNRAQGFESKFKGTAAGRPLVRQEGWLDRLKKEAMNITKTVNGKAVRLVVSKYDKMTYTGHTLGAGPVQVYGEAIVNGEMIYDYGRTAWYFNNVTISYSGSEGTTLMDKLTGNIRWVESPQRKSNGEGEYQFDVRVNEPPPNESAAFAGPSDESAFFQVDDSVSALTGTMKYKDVMSGEIVTGSSVQVDLRGGRLTRQQTMNLAKLILLSAIVPLNAE